MANPDSPLSITDVKLRLVEGGTDGLLAWASCVIAGAILLNNVAIRRGRGGSLYLSFPAKLTSNGSKYHYFAPISREATAAIERAIFSRIRELSGVDHSGQATAAENG